jgi:glycine/D-amino acid oxidase-like deaminating enzyme
VLLERGTLAAGATGHNGGLMVVGTAEDYPGAIARHGHTNARAMWEFTLANHTLLHDVLRDEELNIGYREIGHLKLSLGDGQQIDHRKAVAALHADGFKAELIDRQQAEQLIHTPLAPEITGGLLLPHSGTVHSGRLVLALAQAAQRHGALLCQETRVLSITGDGDGLRITTSRRDIRAARAVVAVNAWSGDLVPSLASIITPVRGQALAFAPTQPLFATGCSAALTSTGEYWQQAADGAIVLGGCRANATRMDVGAREMQPTDEVQSAIEGVLPRLFPNLPPLQVVQRWAGLMAFTPDYTPIADRAPDLPQAWVVGGFSGHGMPFGMRMGQLLAKAVLSDTHSPDLAPFSLARPTLGL